VDAINILAKTNAPRFICPTKSASRDASLSDGIMNKKKNRERIANPLAVRVYRGRLEAIM
jgi:hypothetical protein